MQVIGFLALSSVMPRGILSAQSALAALAQIRPSKLRIDFRNIRLFTVVAAK